MIILLRNFTNNSVVADFIAEKEREQLKHFAVHKSTGIKRQSLETLLNNLLYKDKVNQQQTAKSTELQNIKRTRKEYRILQVECIYGLLNLCHTDDDKIVLERLFQNMAFHKDLIKAEYDLLNYMFESCLCTAFNAICISYLIIFIAGSKIDANYLALKYFSFLYEKPILQLSTKILQMDMIKVSAAIKESKDVKKILDIAKNNNDIKINILELLYELFRLSRYNSKLIILIDFFN